MNCWWWISCQYQLPTKSSLSMLVLTWWGMSCSLMSTIQSRGFVLITESEKQCLQDGSSIFSCTCCCAPCSAPRASRCRRSLPSPSRGSSWKRTPDLDEPGLNVSHCTQYIPEKILPPFEDLILSRTPVSHRAASVRPNTCWLQKLNNESYIPSGCVGPSPPSAP